MILCVQHEKLSEFLGTLSALIDKYDRKEPDFVDAAMQWLQEAEKAMSQLRLPEGAEMSSLRGRILRASDEAAAAGDRVRRREVKRATNAAAAQALERAEEIMRTRFLAAEEKLQQFEDKLCEGMTAFLVEKTLPAESADDMSWLNEIWRQLRENPPTRPLTVYIAASLSTTDRIYILHRVLDRVTAPENLRPPLPAARSVEDIEGIGPATASKLAEVGIATTADLLRLCAEESGRGQIAKQTGLPEEKLLHWTGMADLMRIAGIDGQFAELLSVAGVNTVKELRTRNPNNLTMALAEANGTKLVTKTVPTATEVSEWIETAKHTPPMITH